MLAITTLPGVLAAMSILGLTLYAAIQLRSPISFAVWAINGALFGYQVLYGGFLVEFWLTAVTAMVVVAVSAIFSSRM